MYLNGQPLAQVDSGEALNYLHTDHLGTPRYATNDSGAQVWHWDSDAFGVGTPSGSATVNLRFAGQYWDDESGLHYNWNRYYDPTTGRYISSDPIGLAGGLNTYVYALANPIMYTDPEGLNPVAAGAACFLNPLCRAAGTALGREILVKCGLAASAAATAAALPQSLPPEEEEAPSSNPSGAQNSKGEEGGKNSTSQAAAGAPMPDPDDDGDDINDNIKDLLEAGEKPDRNGLTKSGRALQKHGDRSDSLYPRATGSAANKNQQGQKVLENILKSRNKWQRPNRFGGIDIFDKTTGRGVRYNGAGEMMGFL